MAFEPFKKFNCLQELHPVVFTQFCLFYHQEKLRVQTESSSQDQGNVSSLDISFKAKKEIP